MEQPNIFMSYLRVTQHMSQQFRSHFGRLDLTFPQALVLTVLGEDGPVPISALAERTGSANSTVSGIVDRLEKLGLARRQRSETDRRVIYVCATEKYNALRAKLDGISNTVLSAALRELEGDGLVRRQAYPEVPVRVEYSATERCMRLLPVLESLSDWAEAEMDGPEEKFPE